MSAAVKTIGFVLFRRALQGRQYLLLHHRGKYWNFPKGRAEAGEAGDELATAFRELREETGITPAALTVVDGFRRTYRYRFAGRTADGMQETVTKLAIFYLAKVTGNPAIRVSDEHLNWAWCDYPAAWERLYYPNGRRILAAAQQFLDAKQKDGMVGSENS